MKKSVYSLVLNDRVVEELDQLAYRQGTSRSALINRILADYVSYQTPEMRLRQVLDSAVSALDTVDALQLMLQQEQQHQQTVDSDSTQKPKSGAESIDLSIPKGKLDFFEASLPDLTPTERIIYNAHVEGKTTREIMEEQNIKENTLKYHNKNIYSKLGVSSKKELMEVAKALKLRK